MTRTCRLDWRAPLFTQAEQRRGDITTSEVPPPDQAPTAAVAGVVLAGDATVDLRRALGILAKRGANNILIEGGPDVNGQLAVAGLLDGVCLTVSPVVEGGAAGRTIRGAELAAPTALALKSVLEADGYLFLRYGRR